MDVTGLVLLVVLVLAAVSLVFRRGRVGGLDEPLDEVDPYEQARVNEER